MSSSSFQSIENRRRTWKRSDPQFESYCNKIHEIQRVSATLRQNFTITLKDYVKCIRVPRRERMYEIFRRRIHVEFRNADSEIERLVPSFFYSPPPFHILPSSHSPSLPPSAISSQINQTFESRQPPSVYLGAPPLAPAENFVTGRHCQEFKS